MRMWVLTAWVLCGFAMAQAAAKPWHADRVGGAEEGAAVNPSTTKGTKVHEGRIFLREP